MESPWFLFEKVVSDKGAKAVLRSHFPETDLITLTNIEGTIQSGDIITGLDSGMQKTFTVFDDDQVKYSQIEYKDPRWDLVRDSLIHFVEDLTITYENPAFNSGYLALDEHFNGKESQDFQTTYLVRIDGN